MTKHELPTSSRMRQDWLTGGEGVKINFYIIFTVISFYPEPSILLKIITNNSYEQFGLCQNSTEKGGQSACSGSKAAPMMRLP